MSYSPRSAQHETIIDVLVQKTPGDVSIVENGDTTLVIGTFIIWFVNYSDHYGYLIDHKGMTDWGGHAMVRNNDSDEHEELVAQVEEALKA